MEIAGGYGDSVWEVEEGEGKGVKGSFDPGILLRVGLVGSWARGKGKVGLVVFVIGLDLVFCNNKHRVRFGLYEFKPKD